MNIGRGAQFTFLFCSLKKEIIMRKMNVATMAMLFVLASCPKGSAEMIWSDGFESGNFAAAWTGVSGNWEILSSSAYAHSGSYRASVKGPNAPDGDILLLSEPSTGYQNLLVEYWYKTTSYSLESSDHIFAEWTSNGANWQILADYTSTTTDNWRLASFSLPPNASDNALFGFRLRAALNSDSDRMYFDDFALSGQLVPEPSTLLMLLLLIPFFVLLRICKFK